jgi:hypothetical protein
MDDPKVKSNKLSATSLTDQFMLISDPTSNPSHANPADPNLMDNLHSTIISPTDLVRNNCQQLMIQSRMKQGNDNTQVTVKVLYFYFTIDVKFNTVKLGYNDHGYNKFTAIANRICRFIWSQIFSLLHKVSRL